MSRNILEQPELEQATDPGRITVEVVRDKGGWTQLAEEWRQLAQQCRTATIFQTHEWNLVWWQHFGSAPGRRLHLIVFRAEADGAMVGLAPLITSYWHGTPLRRLSFIGTGASDYLDLLAAPGWEKAVAEEFYRTLAGRRGWHTADLQQLREDGLLAGYRPQEDHGLTCWETAGELCPYLPLPADWDTLTQQFGKKTRANIGYYDRSLRKVYEVAAEPVADSAILGAEVDRLFELHQRRWNKRWLPGVFGSRSVRRFHHDVARALLERGWLRLFVLRLDGRTQASLYCFAFGDRICYYQGGFEPELAKWSLGTVLTAHAIRTAIDEERVVFDFLRGDEPYKAKWTQATRQNKRRGLTRRGWSDPSRLVQRVQKFEDLVERRAKAWARARK